MAESDATEREAYLTLALVPGIGATRFQDLIERFKSASGVLAAPLALLRSVPTLGSGAAGAILGADRRVAKRILAALHAEGGSALLPDDAQFPAALQTIPEPPTYLFIQGNAALLQRPAVAIVGSRDHSRYGAEVCRALARAAAEAGLVVVSGMARGLDAVAHAGALEADGDTIGVLGNGFGIIYPLANRKLYDQMKERGLLLTEFPPGERPIPGSFQRRNRLISGLARITVVVEAALGSGTQLTVECAHAQGREVMAVPGPITSPVSAGTNALIRDGAAPLLELQDLLDRYPELAARHRAPEPGSRDVDVPLERRLVNALHREPLQAEELVELSGAPVSEALDALSALELRGRVRQEPGGRYRLVLEDLFATKSGKAASKE